MTVALAKDVSGARVERVEVLREPKGTTDRARIRLEWNAAGRNAGLPTAAFAKGTPSQIPTRVLNSTFGLCATEVRFYNEVYPDVSWMTLKPYYARVAAGGRFLIVLESRGDETRFYQPHEEATVSHAEAIIDQLAMMHAKFYKSLWFDRDLSWITLYRGRPGQVLAHRTVLLAEKRFFRKYDAPAAVQRLTRFHLENRDAFGGSGIRCRRPCATETAISATLTRMPTAHRDCSTGRKCTR